MTAIASLTADVREWMGDFEGFLGEFTVLDWVLIAVAGAVIAWMVARLRAATRLGPIEVEPIEHDAAEGTDVPVHELTTLLRERLATSGLLPPPEVPGAAPEADVVAAVEASPIPQAAWLATLLKAVARFTPRAPSYRLKGTLIGADRTGIRIWLCPVGGGRELLTTVPAGGNVVDAVEEAAARVFMHITNDAVDVFPAWTRWDGTVALRAYLEGVDLRNEGGRDAARSAFARAASLDRRNVLPRLALANLEELGRDAGDDGGPTVADQARALRRYLDIAVEHPDLVEARYRSSVLAAMLAPECERHPAVRRLVASQLDMAEHDLPETLGQLAGTESDAVLQLVKPWHVAIRQHRPRHRFEPRGRERRELRRTVSISRHCLELRTLPRDDTGTQLWRRIKVRGWHLAGLRRDVGWQAHYNGACFYALLAGRGVGTPEPRWLARDPDLDSLRRDEKAKWDLLLRRHCSHVVDVAPKTRIAHGPARPWGDPARRARRWIAVAASCAAGGLALLLLADAEGAFWTGAGLLGLAVLAVLEWQRPRREVKVRASVGAQTGAE